MNPIKNSSSARSTRRPAQQASGPERRQHPRVQISVDVDFESAHNFYSGRTRDVSAGGLFIETDVGLPIGATIHVDLRFLKTRAQVPAEVVWVLLGEGGGSVGVGVRFISLPNELKQRMEAFMGLRPALDFGLVESADEDDTPVPSDITEQRPPRRGPPPLPKR